MTTELKYEFCKIDKTHCYYLPVPDGAFYGWVWFHIGKNLTASGKSFRLYPFHSWRSSKTILTAKVNDAARQGEMIAKKINKHYLSKSKKQP